jgi:hypothetical protein
MIPRWFTCVSALGVLLGGCIAVGEREMTAEAGASDGGSVPPPGGDASDGLPFGEPCRTDSDCQSRVCFIGGAQSFCTFSCTKATEARDCPVPPTAGTCNNRGYCKKT